MKNKHLTIFLLTAAIVVSMCGMVWAEDGEEEELTGFALFEKLRGMRLEAQSAMAKEDYVEAAKIFRRMARYEKNRARSAAYLLRGADCLMQAKKSHRALEEYTNLMENYPLYVPYEHVVEQLRQLAEWFIVGDGTFLGIRDKDAGIKIYEMIIREAPSMHVTLNDRLRLAELLIESGRGEEAVVVYQTLLRQEMDNWDVHAKLALLFLKLSKSGDGDGAKLRAAVREANIVLQNNPNHPKIKELKKLCKDADNEEANRILQQGEFYLVPAHSRPASARRYFHDVILKYPDSSAAKKAQHYLRNNPALRQLEEAQAAKPPVGPDKKGPQPPKPAPPSLFTGAKPSPSATPSKPVPPPPGGDKKEAEHRKQEEAKRKESEKARLAQEELQRKEAEKAKMKREAEEARQREKKDKERREAEKKAEKARLAEEATRREAAEKAEKVKAKREAEEARLREKQEKELKKKEQMRLEAEKKRQEAERKRLEEERRKADKAAKARAKTEEEERERIEKARVKAEGQVREGGKPRSEPQVKMVGQDKKKIEEAKRQAEEELKRIRERKARMLQQDPKLLEEEQKRLRELMEKDRKTR